MHTTTLLLHVLAGGLGLAAGPVAALAPKRSGLHTTAGWAYQVCCAVLCSTTLVLVVLDPSQWPFLLLAVPTQAAAVAAVVVRRRRPGWLVLHVQLALGSYLSFVTAFCVQTVGGLGAWLVPVVLGSAGISVVTARVARGVPAAR